MSNYKKGDQVQLKSGGPAMTVTYINPHGLIDAKWFAGSKLESGSFPSEALQAPISKKKPSDPE